MFFLVIDFRFCTPIFVFLEIDPRGSEGYPGLAVCEVVIEFAPSRSKASQIRALGRDPHQLTRFREFGSDGAATRAGFILIEPLYVGLSWESYAREFRPQGEKSAKQSRREPPNTQSGQ
jgi:hypothetical protein